MQLGSRIPGWVEVTAGLEVGEQVVHEGVARILEIAAVPDREMRETWEPTKLLREFPRKLTTVEDFVDERITEWRRARVTRVVHKA